MKLKVLVTQLGPTLCDPIECSPPGSSVHGILQGRILEWVAISSSRGSSRPRDRTKVPCIEAGPLLSEPLGSPLWWRRGEESTGQRRRHRFSPWSGKIPHAVEQLSSCTTASEAMFQGPGTEKRRHRNEKLAHSNCNPLTSTREKSVQQWRPSATKIKLINKKFYIYIYTPNCT